MHYRLEYENRVKWSFNLASLQRKTKRITAHWTIYDKYGNVVDEQARTQKRLPLIDR